MGSKSPRNAVRARGGFSCVPRSEPRSPRWRLRDGLKCPGTAAEKRRWEGPGVLNGVAWYSRRAVGAEAGRRMLADDLICWLAGRPAGRVLPSACENPSMSRPGSMKSLGFQVNERHRLRGPRSRSNRRTSHLDRPSPCSSHSHTNQFKSKRSTIQK